MRHVESIAPFAAGGLLFGSGFCAAGQALGFALPAGPMAGASVSTALLVSGAGAGIIIGAWERLAARRAVREAEAAARRAEAQREVALLQARRLRAQAEGLALMREVHRSTAIPERSERLHRILTLLADLFEAREVGLFAAHSEPRASEPRASASGISVQPAACLRLTQKEELFVVFETCDPDISQTGQPAPRVAPKSATIAREGSHLYVEGVLERAGTPVAKVQWRRGANSERDVLAESDAVEVLETALAKTDFGPAACALAAQALERRRTVQRDEFSTPGAEARAAGLVLCVPLLADQRPIGALRVRRSAEGFSGPEAEALEELLLESAKHIALALKKDEDDRRAITDGLTSLYIKRHFLVMLEQFRTDAASSGEPFCLVMCDIDHFKRVNDTHGHLAGDMVLKGVAGVLRRALRAGDIAFRYGGEEMALLLPRSTPDAAEQTAERLRAAVQSAVFRGDKGQTIPVTVSLGIAQHQPGLSADALIARADRALYASKQSGRNRATRWSAELEAANHQPPTVSH